MSTTTAPVQANEGAWLQARIGRITASEIGDLFTEPRSMTAAQKDAKAKGQPVFGETAKALITTKACERLYGVAEHHVLTRSMERGQNLEPIAKILLSQHWKEIDDATFLAYGENAGATPDGYVMKGGATLDIKCPEAFGDVIRFGQEVEDGDFEALKKWNKGYAYQIMMQAKCAGVKVAYLVYFTDRLPMVKVETDEVLEQTGYMMETPGFAFTARRFLLTDELSQQIDLYLQAAEVEIANTKYLIQNTAKTA